MPALGLVAWPCLVIGFLICEVGTLACYGVWLP